MSDDPKRLLDGDSGASDAERDLLRSAGKVEPAAGAQASMWAALATRLPPVGGGGAPPGAGGGGAGAAAAGSAIGAKTVAFGLLSAVIAVGAVVLMRSSGDSPPVPAAAASSAVVVVTPAPSIPPAPAATEISEVPAELGATPVAGPTSIAATASVTRPASSAPRQAAGAPSIANSGATSSADALRDEIALVAAARAALRRGDGAGALATLETARKQHPRGALVQEREVLTIEALAQSGDTAGASRRASAFLRAFPTSPHATHVRTFER